MLQARRLADAWTTSEDAESANRHRTWSGGAGQSRRRIGSDDCDSTWDAEAAAKLDVPTFAVRTGGFSNEELRAAGAVGVRKSLTDLLGELDTVLGS